LSRSTQLEALRLVRQPAGAQTQQAAIAICNVFEADAAHAGIGVKLDPRRAATIEPENPHRLIRAIEIATALGAVPELSNVEPRFNALVIGCRFADTEKYRARIRTRIVERIDAGMFEEAERLQSEGVSLERMRALGLEYRHLADWLAAGALRDTKTVESFIETLALDIWAYARRQRTWFKRRETIGWFDVDREGEIERAFECADSYTMS
jgi:tRNA dimethylallyltransferase